MTTCVSINGTIVEPENAKISVFDRGFLYGDSVFEVLRTYRGQPFALEDHLGRLQRSASIVAMGVSVSIAQLRVEIEAALRFAANTESYIRVVVTRGSGDLGLDTTIARDPSRVIIVQALNPQSRDLYCNGAALATIVTERATDSTSGAGAKSSNYLANILALRAAKNRGAYEAVIITPTGIVLEGSSSNVFIVSGQSIATPSGEGILEGITRRYVMLAATDLGLTVDERRIKNHELFTADEVFITSSLREIVPIVRVDDHEVGDGNPGEFTRRLHRAFRRFTNGADLKLPWEIAE